ncbi:unnamed protein product, partial [Ectocarpus sp. 12 AP-2014]
VPAGRACRDTITSGHHAGVGNPSDHDLWQLYYQERTPAQGVGLMRPSDTSTPRIPIRLPGTEMKRTAVDYEPLNGATK